MQPSFSARLQIQSPLQELQQQICLILGLRQSDSANTVQFLGISRTKQQHRCRISAGLLGILFNTLLQVYLRWANKQ